MSESWIGWPLRKDYNNKCYAESECQVWYNANKMVPPIPQDHITEESQILSLGNISIILFEKSVSYVSRSR